MPVATSDIVNNPIPAITYVAPNETWTVNPSVIVASTSAYYAVFSDQTGSEFVNRGVAHGGAGYGAGFDGSNPTIWNHEGAIITGLTLGLGVDGANAVVENAGTIAGYQLGGVRFDANATSFFLDNTGEVHGIDFGVEVKTAAGGGKIKNDGSIHSDMVGIKVVAGGLTEIVNKGDGVISGGDAALRATAGEVSIVNRGAIDGKIWLGPGSDVYKGKGSGGVSGTVLGEMGDDTLSGGRKSDRFDGGSGNDMLNGGKGDDILAGGDNNDAFLFDTKLGANNVDKITDFAPGADRIHLENKVFDGIGNGGTLKGKYFKKGKAANDGNDHILYHAKSGYLRYDKDGEGGKSAVKFAKLDKKLNLDADDFLVV